MKVCALAGGVGGAKLAAGLQEVLPGGDLSVVVNTADDFDLWGLRVCPDLDTVMYTLAGISNPAFGWGVERETYNFLGMALRYGEDPWFRIGDKDVATHVLRTARLISGEPLTKVTAGLSDSLGVPSAVLPMCEETVATLLDTPDGRLEFQEYFVRRKQEDEVLGVEFDGVGEARPTEAVLDALSGADAVVVCPSNPVVSVGPILAVPGMREAIAASPAPKVAVSPIVAGRALRGPAAEMMASLGHDPSAAGVARMYAGAVDGFVLDVADEASAAEIEALGMRVAATEAVMRDDADRARLAREVLDFARSLTPA